MHTMAYPCRLAAGRFQRLTELEEIAQSVRMILTTRRGERLYRSTFGTRLDQFAFEGMDTTTCNLIRQEVVSSLQTWEPRIWNIQVHFTRRPEEGQLLVDVQYQVRTTGATGQTQVEVAMG